MTELRCAGSGSSGNCYMVRDENGHFLMLDCGIRIPWTDVLQCCDFRPDLIDALLVSHWHKDHLSAVKKFERYGIEVYGSEELQRYVFDTQCSYINHLKERAKSDIAGDWIVVPWYVPHTDSNRNNVPCYAYYVQSPSKHRMVYITDFLYSPMKFKSLNVETILVACNYDGDISGEESSEKYMHVITGHSSLQVVADLVECNKTASLKNVILCHLSRENATPKLMINTIKEIAGNNVNVNIAEKGRTYIL